MDFVYVNGASLSIKDPANAILTSGPLTYPCNRPICAVFNHSKSNGKMIVVGSITMFNDDYFLLDYHGSTDSDSLFSIPDNIILIVSNYT